MPPARRSATKKTAAARASSARKAVRARAASTRAATRREVEQSIARFEKQLDGANDALKTLGTHLGRGAQGSYKEVTTALAALRREASKTNKQALKDFDKLRAAVTHKPAAAKSNSAKHREGEHHEGKYRKGKHDQGEHGEGELPVREGELGLVGQQALDRQALDRVPREDHAREEDQLTHIEQLSGRERRPGVDSRRLVDIEFDRAADAHALAEGHITMYDEPFGVP